MKNVTKPIKSKPIILAITEITRDGLVTVGFNQVLKIPYFMHNITTNATKADNTTTKENKKRKLEEEIYIEDIKIDEILKIYYVFR